MKVLIENFSKIGKAEIELNGITIIAGENNTGKSTIGKVLFCFYKAFNQTDRKIFSELTENTVRKLIQNADLSKNRELMRYRFRKKLREIIREFIIDSKCLPSIERRENLIRLLNNNQIVLSDGEQVIDEILKNLDLPIDSIHNSGLNRLFNNEFNYQYKPLNGNKGDLELTLFVKDQIVKIGSDDELCIKDSMDLYVDPIYIDSPLVLDRLDALREDVDNGWAYRSEWYGHSTDLSLKLAKSFSNQVEEDLVEQTLRKKRISEIMEVFDTMVEGEFSVIDNSVSFQEKGMIEPLKVSNLSMGTKVFAILRRLVEDGYITENGLVILDEPEVHLHPKWQLKIANILVLLQKEFNLNILVNSHSPYFIRAIEVYSQKHEIEDKCKYYVSALENNTAFFKDVTSNTNDIYSLLATPLNELNDLAYED